MLIGQIGTITQIVTVAIQKMSAMDASVLKGHGLNPVAKDQSLPYA